ncbi:TPA: hypothetical protein U5E22_002484 [Yersinia enterocolitica]|nr:hypothetical protein [Yersinia enterocolitica]
MWGMVAAVQLTMLLLALVVFTPRTQRVIFTVRQLTKVVSNKNMCRHNPCRYIFLSLSTYIGAFGGSSTIHAASVALLRIQAMPASRWDSCALAG